MTLLTQTPKPAAPFTTPLTPAEMTNKQAVVTTTAGTFVIDLRPDLAPNHVGYFIKLAARRARSTTRSFTASSVSASSRAAIRCRTIPRRSKQYGTGGLGVLKAEPRRREARRAAPSQRCCSRASQTARARSSSSASPISRRSTASTRSSDASPKAWTSSRRSPKPPPTTSGMPIERIEITQRRDPRHAAAGAGSVRGRTGGGAREVSRGARNVGGPDHDRVLPRQGAGTRPQLPSARRGGRLRRHVVSSRRPRLRRSRPDR